MNKRYIVTLALEEPHHLEQLVTKGKAAARTFWQAPTTTPADRQRVAHLLLEWVVVTVVETSEQVAVRLEWAAAMLKIT